MSNIDAKPKTLVDFLGKGKAHGRFYSAQQIDEFIVSNREDWIIKQPSNNTCKPDSGKPSGKT